MLDLQETTLISPGRRREITRWRQLLSGGAGAKGAHATGIAGAITGTVATLATSELYLSVKGGQRARFLREALEKFQPKLTQGVQWAAALGCCILRPRAEQGELVLELIPGDRFYPTRLEGNGIPSAGYFLDHRQVGQRELIRLEGFDFREGTLLQTNRAFEFAQGAWRQVPLDSLEDWAGLEKSVTIEGISSPLFGYLQMPLNGDLDSPLPKSLYSGAESTMEEFDRLWGELLYELHSGKRKRIIERQALPGLTGQPVPGALGYQDLSSDTYLVLDPEEQVKPFDDYSPAIRTEEYLTGLGALLRLLENQCRLSPGTLRLEALSGGPTTATEVVAREKSTYHTCGTIQRLGILPALNQLFAAMDALCDLYELCPPGEAELSVTFGDSVFEDTGTEFARRLEMVQAGVLEGAALREWYFHDEGKG